ncbi:MAG: hypothetical protein AAGH81_18670 [Bacteroidota bacterium]
MKNIFVTLSILICTAAFAQKESLSNTQKKQLDEKLEQYFTKLELTAEQRASYGDITRKYKDQQKFIWESGLSNEEKRTEIKKMQLQKDAEMMQLLTKEQYKEYETLKKELKEKIMEDYPKEILVYLERLELSDGQRPKFIEITKRYREKFMVLKNSPKSRLSKYREFKEIKGNKDREMKSLLTGDQYQLYLEVQSEVQKEMMDKNGK